MGRKSLIYYSYKILVFLFIVFVILPLLYTLGQALFESGASSLLKQVFSYEALILLAKSIFMSLTVAVLSVIIALFLAFALYKTNLYAGRIIRLILLLPLFVPPYIYAVAYKDIFNAFLGSLQGGYAMIAVIFLLVIIYVPLALIIIGGALSNTGIEYEEAAWLFTSKRKTIIKILLPLIKPAVFSAFVLVFIFSISEYSIPVFFGVRVYTTEIFTQFSAFYNHSLAVYQSFLLVIICFVLLYYEHRYIAEAPFLSMGNKGLRIKKYNLGRFSFFVYSSVVFWLVLTVILPVAVLLRQVLMNTGIFMKAIHLMGKAIANSISLSVVAASVIVFMAFVIAYYNERHEKNRRYFDNLLLVVFAIPSIIFGISLIKFYNTSLLDFIYSGSMILIIAYTGKFLFIAVKLASNSLKQIPFSYEEASLMAGAGFLKTLRSIILPLMMPVLFLIFLLAFIFSMSEISLTLMVYPPGMELMPVKVFTIMANAPDSLNAAMSLISFGVVFIALMVLYLIYNKVFEKARYRI